MSTYNADESGAELVGRKGKSFLLFFALRQEAIVFFLSACSFSSL